MQALFPGYECMFPHSQPNPIGTAFCLWRARVLYISIDYTPTPNMVGMCFVCSRHQSFQPYKIFMKYRACASIENTEHVRRWRYPEALWGANQGSKCNLTFDPWKSSDQEPQKGMIKWSNTLFAPQKTWSWLQTPQQAITTPWSDWLDQWKWLTLSAA